MLLKLVIVGAGGFLGSIGRYLVGVGAERIPGYGSFPFGTVIANLAGCLLIGVLAGIALVRPTTLTDETRLFLIVGVLGGFTTFSAFGLDTLTLLKDESTGYALLNVGLQVGLGLVAVWVGLEGARGLLRG